jgi:RND superfamily putative drug exporter
MKRMFAKPDRKSAAAGAPKQTSGSDNTGLNPAARMGRWSAQHRKTAIWGWLAFVVIAFMIGSAVGLRTADDAHLGVGESGRADLTVDAAFPQSADEMVLVQSAKENADGIPFRAAVGDAEYRLSQLPFVHSIESPYEPANRGQISPDGHSALIQFKIAGDQDEAKSHADDTLRTIDEVQAAHPDLTVGEFGDASADNQVSASISNDFRTALITSLPITLLILLVAFGALVAAGVPLLLGLTAVIATIGLIGPISHIGNGVDESISEVVLLIGLAVGVDYSMFYLRREREEREAGRSEGAALAAAAATSGRAVMVSGFTVMIAMAGMYLAGASTFQSFATGTILVVAVAVVGSLTVLPAVLAWLGDRVEKGRIPFLSRKKWAGGEGGAWSRVLNPALRRPVVSVVIAGGFLLFLAIPAFSLHTATPGVETLPQDLGVIKTYNRIQAAFPGGPIPAQVVVSADDVKSPEVIGAVNELRARAAASDNFEQPITTTVNPDHTVEQVDIPVVGDGTDSRSTAALAELRDELIPATIGQVPGATADVTGYTANSTDFNDTMKSHAPVVFVFVLSAAFLLLLFTFRSIVIPVKAILLNLLSVGAAYGVMVWIFQEGHLESVLGFESNGAIVSWMPLFMFVVLFGLSMDYHVFILTRIREAFDRGSPTEEAVAHGIKTTAGVVTSAAAVMISVFAIFATLSLLIFKQLGIGLAVAVLIDATIIRGVLLPASMKLLGDWNWYLPRWLEWLPRVGPGGGTYPPAPPPRPAAAEDAPARGPAG